jgi:hypothetical protein
VYLVESSKWAGQDGVVKSDVVNTQKRKRGESTLDISCKRHKVSWTILIISRNLPFQESETISIQIKVADLVINISVQEGMFSTND